MVIFAENPRAAASKLALAAMMALNIMGRRLALHQCVLWDD